MQAYGVDPKDHGCCPGHDKFPRETYRNARSHRARKQSKRISHKRARAREREQTRVQVLEVSESFD